MSAATAEAPTAHDARRDDVRAALRAGRVRDAAAALARWGAPPRGQRLHRREEVEHTTLSIACLLARGEVAGAEELTAVLDEVTDGPSAPLALHARGEVASARDDHAAALDLHLAAGAAADGTPDDDDVPWRLGAAWALVRCGRGAEAEQHARQAHERALARGDVHDVAHALRTLATVAPDGRAAERLQAARALLDGAGSHRLAAQVDTDLAGLMILRGDAVSATLLLRDVERYAAREDLWPLQSRARRLLQRLGETPLRLESEALVGLTPAERRVAVLALDGLPNRGVAERLGVSVKAVEGHLSRIYRKLGVTSRVDLIAAVGRHG